MLPFTATDKAAVASWNYLPVHFKTKKISVKPNNTSGVVEEAALAAQTEFEDRMGGETDKMFGSETLVKACS